MQAKNESKKLWHVSLAGIAGQPAIQNCESDRAMGPGKNCDLRTHG
jgi:hypothetical protein